jgi:hypothetical protein
VIFFRQVLVGEAQHIPSEFDAHLTYHLLLDLDEQYIHFETAPKLIASWRSPDAMVGRLPNPRLLD